MKTYSKKIILGALCTALTACSGFFDKDNTPTPTPLTYFRPEVKTQMAWSSHVNFGSPSTDHLELIPAIGHQAVFTTSNDGVVTATDKLRGRTLWKKYTYLTLSAGPSTDNNNVFVGGRKGKVLALSQTDGKQLWETQLTSEILSPPSARDGKVYIKTIDGEVTALSQDDGHMLWHYQQTEPTLILRGGSAPQVSNNAVIAGFENGNLVKLNARDGDMIWQTTVAVPEGSFAIQRMVDIDATPTTYNGSIYVATYQGKIASLDMSSGKEKWNHDISSFTGLTIDGDKLYVTDASSHLWTFDTNNGGVNWRQNELASRNITAPALMDRYIVVGDGEGYIHWMNKNDGHFVARERFGHSPIIAAPVVDNSLIYVLTQDGYLAAYKLG